MRKRTKIELHCHTKMSVGKGVIEPGELVRYACDNGYKAIAITDCGTVQAFPRAYRTWKKLWEQYMDECRQRGEEAKQEDFLKVIYGLEGSLHTESGEKYPILLYAKNETGIRNLYKIVTESHLSTYYDEPTITKEILDKYRDGILVGAVCDGGEIMITVNSESASSSDEEYRRKVSYYDFIEVSPFGTDRGNEAKYVNYVVNNGGMLVAASDAYYLNEEDKIYWEILTNGRAEEYTDRPRHLIKWDEVTNPFGCWFLGQPEILKDIPKMVIANQSVIADQIEYVSPLREGRFMPNYPEAEQKLRHICEERLHELFGKDPAEEARNRLERELDGICKSGYAGLFMMWRDIAKKSIEKGYPFNSRGSVGSSFVAFLCEITDINPLSSECGGYNIPVETFLGINLDKEPDIDLNFAPEIQVFLQDYVKDIPGVGDACHAGTIDCLWEKLARMHVEEYYYHNNLSLPDESILREQTEAIIGIKRIDDVHPGGIVVAPAGEELVSFTPLQHPGDSNRITTTHFDYHAIDHNLIKLDILGLRHMSILHELQELTGVALDSIPVNDKKVLDKILDPEVKEIEGLLEFGSEVARRMIKQTCPESMDDLIKVSGLIHGTDVWLDNQDELFNNKVISLKDCVASRDDIFLALVDKGINKKDAFYIDRKSTRLNSSHPTTSRMPSSA